MPKEAEQKIQITSICNEVNDELSLKVENQIKSLDKRLVNMRNEFDLDALKKIMKSKVDVKDLHKNDEFNNNRISSLEEINTKYILDQ